MLARSHTLYLLILLVLGASRSARAAEAGVPAKHQAALLMRILSYDRKLPQRAIKEVVVGLLYREGASDSESVQREMFEALSEVTGKLNVGGMRVKLVKIPYSTGTKLDDEISKTNTRVLYVCPGLEDHRVEITRASHARSALTFSPSESQVRDGLSVGLIRKNEKALILVNLPSAKAEGADLDATFLRLAEVIR